MSEQQPQGVLQPQGVRVCDDPHGVVVATCGCATEHGLRNALRDQNGVLGLWHRERAVGGSKGHAVLLYQRRLWRHGPPPPMLAARWCPFCGEPYAEPGTVPLTRAERAVLQIAADPAGAAAALERLAQRGLLSAEEAGRAKDLMGGEHG